jgi:hypothetical protein
LVNVFHPIGTEPGDSTVGAAAQNLKLQKTVIVVAVAAFTFDTCLK